METNLSVAFRRARSNGNKSLGRRANDLALGIGTKAVNPGGAGGWPPAFIPTKNPEFPKKIRNKEATGSFNGASGC